MVEKRGAVGESAFHVCFLMQTPTHLALGRRLLLHYPKLINDVYLSEEYYGMFFYSHHSRKISRMIHKRNPESYFVISISSIFSCQILKLTSTINQLCTSQIQFYYQPYFSD